MCPFYNTGVGSDSHSGMTLPAELNGGNGEAMNGVLSESPDTAGGAADNAGLSVPPVSPGGPESGMHHWNHWN